MMDPRNYDRDAILNWIQSRGRIVGTCVVYGKHRKSNVTTYKRIAVKSKSTGKKKQVYVHRLYFALKKFVILGSSRIWQVSHLCGLKSCFNIEHLSLEPGCVNAGRNSCFKHKSCHGKHGGYPGCVISNK